MLGEDRRTIDRGLEGYDGRRDRRSFFLARISHDLIFGLFQHPRTSLSSRGFDEGESEGSQLNICNEVLNR